MSAVPDIGDTFTVTKTWRFRQWRWQPFPWYAKRAIHETHSYRVTGWMRRRAPRPQPAGEHERLARQMIDELLAESDRVIEPAGWEATEYERYQDDGGGAQWLPAGYTYAPADAEMIAIAARYA